MLAHMKPAEKGGSRVAIIMNGSPLFTGDAGSGESEIRRWIIENDWLEALIALPEQLFYNWTNAGRRPVVTAARERTWRRDTSPGPAAGPAPRGTGRSSAPTSERNPSSDHKDGLALGGEGRQERA
jgi:hypothetical protein